MSRQFQNQLLNFMESGRVKVDQQKKQYDFEIKGAKVFATCNEIKRLSKPLQSRFRKLFLPKYTETQFLDVSVKVLPKLSIDLAHYIGSCVWKNGGDIRDALSIGKLVRKNDGPEAVERIIGKTRIYKELLKGRFRLTKVVRIDRKDDGNEVSDKIIDYSYKSIEELMNVG